MPFVASIAAVNCVNGVSFWGTISLMSMLITFALGAENNASIISTACQKFSPPGTGVPVEGTILPSRPSMSFVKWTGPSIVLSESRHFCHLALFRSMSAAKNVVILSSVLMRLYSSLEKARMPI